jgi:chemotaxis protein methyltransferase CheR
VSVELVISARDFASLRVILRRECGFVLEDGKEYLLRTRLEPMLQQGKFDSLSALVTALMQSSASHLLRELCERMVTHETSFFRDVPTFEALRNTVIPEIMQRRSAERRMQIWCAGCSTGQEPYSLAMMLHEHFPELRTWNVSLLATDLSRVPLEQARSGRFSQLEVNRGLPISLLVKYFEQQGTHWQLRPLLRSTVTFEERNLVSSWAGLPSMDLVLMRNVMIYFDVETRKEMLGRLLPLLQPAGYLVLGASESTQGIDSSYRRVEAIRSGVYQPARPA